MLTRLLNIATLLISAIFLASCGGGGGSGDSVDFSPLQGAEIFLSVSDSVIALGDRLEVSIDVSNITNHAALIKVRYPDSLKYIDETARLSANDTISVVSPVVGPRRSPDDQLIYLVFDISQVQLGENEYGALTFQLRGKGQDFEAHLEVDSDIHEADKTVDELFKINKPLFSPEDSIVIQIN